MKGTRSIGSVVHSEIEIKVWMDCTPTVEEVRPAACVRCEAASGPVGGRLQVVGHGLRDRQVWGPLFGERAIAVVVRIRRFLCLVCGAVMTVLPRGVLGSRLYAAAAIALALALWAIRELSTASVRSKISPWPNVADPRQWAMPARWVRAVRTARLFANEVRPSPASWTHRQVAERVVSSLASRGHPGADALHAQLGAAT